MIIELVDINLFNNLKIILVWTYSKNWLTIYKIKSKKLTFQIILFLININILINFQLLKLFVNFHVRFSTKSYLIIYPIL